MSVVLFEGSSDFHLVKTPCLVGPHQWLSDDCGVTGWRLPLSAGCTKCTWMTVGHWVWMPSPFRPHCGFLDDCRSLDLDAESLKASEPVHGCGLLGADSKSSLRVPMCRWLTDWVQTPRPQVPHWGLLNYWRALVGLYIPVGLTEGSQMTLDHLAQSFCSHVPHQRFLDNCVPLGTECKSLLASPYVCGWLWAPGHRLLILICLCLTEGSLWNLSPCDLFFPLEKFPSL